MNRSVKMTKGWIQLSAWITLQALIVTSLSASLAWGGQDSLQASSLKEQSLRIQQRQETGQDGMLQSLAAAGLEEVAVDSEAAIDVLDGTTDLINNGPDFATPALALANRVLLREVDSQVAFVAVYSASGLKKKFKFDLKKPVESVVRLARAKGIPLSEFKVALDTNPSPINTEELPRRLRDAGIHSANIFVSGQIMQAIHVVLNNDPASKLHERSPWFTDSSDVLVGVVGATEVPIWANAIAQIPDAKATVAFFPDEARQAKDLASLWEKEPLWQPPVQGRRKRIFELSNLADMEDTRKLVSLSHVNSYMNFPGIRFDDEQVTAYTLLFQEGEQPIVLVDRLTYVVSREDALERTLDVSDDFRNRYKQIYEAMKRHSSMPAQPVVRPAVNLSDSFPYGQEGWPGWPEQFLGLRLVSSRAYDLQGHPVLPFEIRGSGNQDTLAPGIASGWMRGIARRPDVDLGQSKKAVDRLTRDVMAARMASDSHRKRVMATEGDRDGSATWPIRTVLGGLEEVSAERLATLAGNIEQFAERFGAQIPENGRILLFLTQGTSGDSNRATNQVLRQLNDEFEIKGPFVQVPYLIPTGDVQEYLEILRAIRQGFSLETGQQVIAATAGAPFKLEGMELFDERDPEFEGVPGAEMFIRRDDGRIWSTLIDSKALADWFEDEVQPFEDLEITVLGLGGVGLGFVGQATSRGAKKVVVADSNAEQVALTLQHYPAPTFNVSAVDADVPVTGAASKPLHDAIVRSDATFNLTGLGKGGEFKKPPTPLVDAKDVPLQYRDNAVVVDANFWLRSDKNFLLQAEGVNELTRRFDGSGFSNYSDSQIVQVLLREVAGVEVGRARVLELIQAAGMEELPPSPIQSWVLEASGVPSWQRLVYTLADGSRWTGGVIREDVPEDQIHATAYVSAYSTVEGTATRLEAGTQIVNSSVIDSAVRQGAKLVGSSVEQALIHPNAQINDSVLEPAFEEDSWSYSETTVGNPDLWVANHSVGYQGHTYQVEVGDRLTANGAVFQSSVVGPDSRVEGSAVIIARWGPKTHLAGGVKSLLMTAASGHAEVAGVQHRPEGEVPAALEVAEKAIVGLPESEFPGTQVIERRVGYDEATVLNFIPLVTGYEGGTLQVEQVVVPPITLVGDYGIDSIYVGGPNPESIMTDGESTPGEITKLAGVPGAQSSSHGRIIRDPLSVVAAFTNLVGRLLGFPALDDPIALLTEPEVTHVGAAAVVGVDDRLGLRGLEAWGQVISGEGRGQLTRSAGIAPWMFLYAPEVLFTLMGRLGAGLPPGEESRYDDLPQRLLRHGLFLSLWALDQEQAKGTQSDSRIVHRLERYVRGFEFLIESDAWTGQWVQEGTLRRPEHWRRVGARWQSDRLSLEQGHQLVHPDPDTYPYQQVQTSQLLSVPEEIARPNWSDWTPYYLTPADLATEPITPLDQLNPVPDELLYQARRIIGQDKSYYYTVEGGRIGREVDLKRIAPSAFLGPGTVLTGKRTSVGEKSRLLRVVADQTPIGRRVRLTAVKATNSSIKDDVQLTWAKLDSSRIGERSVGTYIGVADNSQIGQDTTFEPFAMVVDSTTAPGNVIGVSLVHSRTQSGFMGRHLSTAVHYFEQQPLQFDVKGRGYLLKGASLNAAGGSFIQGRPDAPVRMSVAYPLSLTTVRPSREGVSSEVGAFSVLKNVVELDGILFPFTFHSFDNLALTDPRFRTPGRHNDKIAGVLPIEPQGAFSGIFMRNFIERLKLGIRAQLLAERVPEAGIPAHPEMLKADYAVEAIIVRTLRATFEQLGQVDREAYFHLRAAINALVLFMGRDLAQIDEPDQTALGSRPAQERQRLSELLEQLQSALADLPGSRPDAGVTSPSGHTARQLLDGIGRLVANLDGRWRMRNHTFTEVKWRYVDYEDGKPMDTWKPVSQAAGLEENLVVQVLFNRMPQVRGASVDNWIKRMRRSRKFPDGSHRVSSVREAAQFIDGHYNVGPTYLYSEAERVWRQAVEALPGVLPDPNGSTDSPDPHRVAWARAVLERLQEMNGERPPLQDPMNEMLVILQQQAGLEEESVFQKPPYKLHPSGLQRKRVQLDPLTDPGELELFEEMMVEVHADRWVGLELQTLDLMDRSLSGAIRLFEDTDRGIWFQRSPYYELQASGDEVYFQALLGPGMWDRGMLEREFPGFGADALEGRWSEVVYPVQFLPGDEESEISVQFKVRGDGSLLIDSIHKTNVTPEMLETMVRLIVRAVLTAGLEEEQSIRPQVSERVWTLGNPYFHSDPQTRGAQPDFGIRELQVSTQAGGTVPIYISDDHSATYFLMRMNQTPNGEDERRFFENRSIEAAESLSFETVRLEELGQVSGPIVVSIDFDYFSGLDPEHRADPTEIDEAISSMVEALGPIRNAIEMVTVARSPGWSIREDWATIEERLEAALVGLLGAVEVSAVYPPDQPRNVVLFDPHDDFETPSSGLASLSSGNWGSYAKLSELSGRHLVVHPAWYSPTAGLEELSAREWLDRPIPGMPFLQDIPVRSLLRQIPLALDPWLDKLFKVVFWGADLDHTLSVPDGRPMVTIDLVAQSLRETGAYWLINSGSSVGEKDASGALADNDIGRRLLIPMEEEFADSRQTLQRLSLQGAVGQQLVSYDSSGDRVMRGNSTAPTFDAETQKGILAGWLHLLVENYPDQQDRVQWTERIDASDSAAALEKVAKALGEAWGIPGLGFARRGANLETGEVDPEQPGTIAYLLPNEGGPLLDLIPQFGEWFDREIRPNLTPEPKPTITGSDHVTVTFYSKDEEVYWGYREVMDRLPEEGFAVMIGDNTKSDTHFRLTAAQLGRPTLAVLVDPEEPLQESPNLLRSSIKGVEGGRQTLQTYLDAERNGTLTRDVPLFYNSFSIGTVEARTGHSWRALRVARRTLAGLEEGIQLKPGVAAERLIFVSSGLASPALFQGVRQFRPTAGEQLSVVVFAEHALHADEIKRWAAEAGITLREVVNVKDQYSGDEHRAIANKFGQYEVRYQVHLVQLPSDLDGLGPFLQIDPVKFRTWKERYEATLYGSQV